jgi:hypothetical protein
VTIIQDNWSGDKYLAFTSIKSGNAERDLNNCMDVKNQDYVVSSYPAVPIKSKNGTGQQYQYTTLKLAGLLEWMNSTKGAIYLKRKHQLFKLLNERIIPWMKSQAIEQDFIAY